MDVYVLRERHEHDQQRGHGRSGQPDYRVRCDYRRRAATAHGRDRAPGGGTAHYVREAHDQRQRVRELETAFDALVEEIRDWNEDGGDILHDSLEAILAKHE